MQALLVLFALILCSASSVASAQALCPAANRLRFKGQVGPDLNLLDGAQYSITLGRTDRFNNPGVPLGQQAVSAIVFRNGVCHRASGLGQWFAYRTNEPIMLGLPGDSNLCLGNGNDVLEIVMTQRIIDCDGIQFIVNSMNYGNPARRLSTFGGGGDDFLLGGLGSDSIFGGIGGDVLFPVSEGTPGPLSDDRLFGEDGNDALIGSPPPGTLTMSGGAGNDQINHQCRPATVTCGLGTDSVSFAPSARPFGVSCETWSRAGC